MDLSEVQADIGQLSLRALSADGKEVPVNYRIIGNAIQIEIADLPIGLYFIEVLDKDRVLGNARLMTE